MRVRIVVDSVADVTEAVKERLTVVPLSISFGQEQYTDGVTLTREQFYEKLAGSDVLPTTSQPSPDAFARVYEEAIAAGEEVVVLAVSSKLSGTYQSAMIAAQDYPAHVYVVDTLHVALGEGVLAEYALRLADGGMGAAEIAGELVKARERVHLYAVVDTLEYLQRGGRVSRAVALAGGLLSIKPLVCVKDGRLDIAGKARGNKQCNALMNKEIESIGGIDFDMPMLVGYTGISDRLLKRYLVESAEMWRGHQPQTTLLSGIVGTHAGPNAVVVAFFARQ